MWACTTSPLTEMYGDDESARRKRNGVRKRS
jgi:hypothetical protein